MQFYRKEDEVASWVNVPEHLCGWNGVAHGGVICTILDEIMSWTAMHLTRKLIMTRTLTVAFLKPVYTRRPIKVVGHLETRVSDREALLGAQLVDTAGICLARSHGTFALINVAAARRMKVIDPAIVDGFERFLGESQKDDAKGSRPRHGNQK